MAEVDWKARCLERERRLTELAMWARKMGLPNSLAGNRVRKLLDLKERPFNGPPREVDRG